MPSAQPVFNVWLKACFQGNHPLPPSSCGAHVSKWCLTGQNGVKMYTVIHQTSEHYHTSAQTPSVNSS